MQLRTCLVNSVENDLKFCKFKVISQLPYQLNSLFHNKDSLKKKIFSDIKITYYGKK